jgi:hypothetical protein
MSKKLITTISVLSALAAAAVAAPVATADGGPPQLGGGCHMVWSPSATGLTYMMSGSANGQGAGEMVQMLSLFDPNNNFCSG